MSIKGVIFDFNGTLFWDTELHNTAWDMFLERMSIEKEDIYQDLCLKQNLGLAEGSIDFFNFLITQKIPFTIATAADLYNVDFYFRHLNLGLYFDKSKVIYSDGSIKSKPEPEIFFKALKVLGLAAEEVLIFEDSNAGISAAENALVKKIIIVNSTGSDYSRWTYKVIRNFAEVDRGLFI